MEKVNLFWHRRDLRSTDNTGLFYALNDEFPVLPIFIFDRQILDDLEDKDDARVEFIHNQITRLNRQYEEAGCGLWTAHATPQQAFDSLLATYDVQSVYTNRDYEPYAKERDKQIQSFLESRGVAFYTFKDQVIFEEGEVLTDTGEPYKVFSPYMRKWMDKFKKTDITQFKSADKLSALYATHSLPAIPSLEAMGFTQSELQIPRSTVSNSLLQSYDERRNFPAVEGTSRIGIHLRFGTVSVREYVQLGYTHSATWLNELIWREFYMMILAHFPHVVDKAFKAKYDQIPWLNNEDHFQRWCEGKTGYPIVDAGMRELNQTGFMHNRVRMVVASFLTKHLLIDWRWGERYFARKLLDFELSSNNGGWQWAAGTGTDAQPYFRVFNPTSQQEKFDKELKYIRQWVPEFGTSAYPDPIVPHKEARLRAIETYKEALS